MSEEEKKAIDNLKKLVQLRKNKRGEIKHDTCICGTKDLEIALNLIQKQQKEIEKQDKTIDEMVEFLTTRIGVICPNEDCDFNLDCENRCDTGIEKECWKEYFERKIENEIK